MDKTCFMFGKIGFLIWPILILFLIGSYVLVEGVKALIDEIKFIRK